MDWSFKVRGEDITLTVPETVTAVRPATDLLEKMIPSDAALTFGPTAGPELLGDIAGTPPASRSDLEVFRRAGWVFVEPFPAVALAAEARTSIPGAQAVQQLFLTGAGDLLIGTNLATVRLPPDLTEAEVMQVLKDDQLSIVYQLNFAPNTFEVRLPSHRPLPEIIDQLQARTDRYIYAEPSLLQVISGRCQPNKDDKDFGKQWQHHNDGSGGGIKGMDIRSLAAWKTTRGNGVRIAIIDNGMQVTHPDLKEGIIGGGFFNSHSSGEADFTPLQPGMTNFPEDNDHGTFCLGMAGARMNNDTGGCGSAPEAHLLAIACARDQTATQTTLARAIHYAADPSFDDKTKAPADGADVISCSLHTKNLLTSVLSAAIECASKHGRNDLGVPIFWAVNNKAVEIEEDQLCSHPEVIAVGRSNRSGEKDGSAFGPRLEFLAPGRDVFSTVAHDGFSKRGFGTSFATPLAAGVAALVLSVNPKLTASEVRQILRKSCIQVSVMNGKPHDEYGSGLLNADEAVKEAVKSVAK